ncbi:hypothetical protein A0H81_06850 [Grifola frondosa]|uniref:F-box domain-containing protein n=1 Tax=Grifola frondosa TaxID=5627 RepID=A0A1C7MA22_GRIFR|nr:hypothetical protein A0H81_06850 [Grifola frondosa]
MERALSEVTLSDPRRALQFCTYMVSDPPKRAYWLCCLRITSRAFDVDEEALIWKQGVFSWARRLADLLEEAQNLRLLTISCMDALLWEEPRIGEAISALSNLTHLELYETGRLALDLVGTMCCRPNKLVLSLLQSRRRTTPVLSRILHLNSIRCLTLSHLKEIDNFLQNGKDGPLQLSNVRDLSIEGSSVPLSVFVRVFPNIHHMRVFDTSCLGLHSLGSLWPRLRHLCGHPHHLKDWPKNSPIHCLELDTTLCQHRQQEISDALLALEHLSPIVLSVELLVSVEDIGFCTSLIQAAPRLRYLQLRLNIGIDLANILLRG